MKYGEIWLVDFDPSVGHEFQKQRPGVVIQTDIQIRKSSLATIMPLTTNTKSTVADDIVVTRNNRNHLFADSVVKVYSIMSFDRSRFIRRIGAMQQTVMRDINSYITRHFGV